MDHPALAASPELWSFSYED